MVDWCLDHHSRGHEIVVVTGRDAWARGLTAQWLSEHLPVPIAGLHMRRDGDFRSNVDPWLEGAERRDWITQSEQTIPLFCSWLPAHLGHAISSHRGDSFPHVEQGKVGRADTNGPISPPSKRLTPTEALPRPCSGQTTGVDTSPTIP